MNFVSIFSSHVRIRAERTSSHPLGGQDLSRLLIGDSPLCPPAGTERPVPADLSRLLGGDSPLCPHRLPGGFVVLHYSVGLAQLSSFYGSLEGSERLPVA